MEYCPQCGDKLVSDGSHCGSCGAELPDGTRTTQPDSTDISDSSGLPEGNTGGEDQRFIPKEKAGIIGIMIGLLGSLGIMTGSLLQLGTTESGYPIGISTEPESAMMLFAIGFLLCVLVVDDYKELGLLGSWEPRKTRVYGIFGIGLLIALFAVVPRDELVLGGKMLLGIGGTLIGFSILVGFWKLAFRKKAGAK